MHKPDLVPVSYMSRNSSKSACQLDSGHLISRPVGEIHPADENQRGPTGIKILTGVPWYKGSGITP